jgi:molybdenum cofactor synthesis domain-containing protein
MFGLAILTVSSSGYLGQRADTGSEAIQEVLAPPEYGVVRYEIVSDEKEMIAQRMALWADAPDVDLVVSTGGTGLGHRDVTPEACRSILDKEVPGLAEAMRAETLKFTPMAMISRSVAGIRGSTLIITLPGSPRGVKETLAVVKPVLPHAIELLKQDSVNEHPR